MGDEAGALRGVIDQAIERGVLDLVATPAFLAEQQQHPFVRVAEMLARSVSVPALDLVDETVLQKELDRKSVV